jgi:hypothetical protein
MFKKVFGDRMEVTKHAINRLPVDEWTAWQMRADWWWFMTKDQNELRKFARSGYRAGRITFGDYMLLFVKHYRAHVLARRRRKK